MPAGAFGRLGRAFRSRDFRRFTVGSSISLIGLWMQRIAVGWVTWELTGSGVWLGVVAFADLFPTVLVSPFSGVLADRFDRRRIALLTQGLAMSGSALLALLSLGDNLSLSGLIVLTAFQGLVISFWQPARMALLPDLVRPGDLATAVALNSVIFNAARFIGPALAGPLLVYAGPGWVFAVNALSYVAMLVALAGIHPPRRPAGGTREGLLKAILTGYRYTLHHPGISVLLGLMITSSLCLRPVAELLPGFADQVFQRGADGLAALAGAIGVGAVAGGLWLAQRATVLGLTRWVLGSLLVLVLALVGFVLTGRFILALVCLAVAGGAMVIAGAGTQTLVQQAVSPDKRGRVMALFGMVFRGAPALGALWLGGLSEWLGLSLALAVGCGLAGGVGCWAWRRRRALQQVLEVEF